MDNFTHHPHMDKPTFDCDGYPTDETLDAIRKWNIHDNASIASLLSFIEQAWRYTFKLETGTDELGKQWLRTATCGWSGN